VLRGLPPSTNPACSVLGPGEEGDATLVPDVAWDALGRDHHRGDQVGALLVQIDRDLDHLIAHSLIDLADVHPLEVHQGQLAAKRLSELDGLVVQRVLSSLHREAGENES